MQPLVNENQRLSTPLADRSATASTVAVGADSWRVGTTAVVLGAMAVLSKGMGFGEKIVIAHYLGTSPSSDTYFAMTSILFSVVFMVRELVYPTLMPTLNQAMALSSDVFDDLLAKTIRWVVLLLAVAAMAAVMLLPQAARFLVPGFPDSQREEFARLLRLTLPAGMMMAMMAVTYTALNAKGRLVIATLAEVTFKAVLLTGAFLFIPLSGLSVIPFAVLAGAMAGLGIHLVVLRPSGVLSSNSSPAAGRLLGRTVTLMAPIAIGVVFSHISDLVDNVLASGLPAGQLSYLSYAKKITDAILLAGPAALATVLYARASRLASLSRRSELTELVSRGLRLLLFLGVPISCVMIGLRMQIVRALFQHGSFDPGSTSGVAGALVIYGAGMVALCVESLCVYSFYSLSDTRTPVAAGVLCVLINIALAVLMCGPLAYLGIAAALVIAKSVKVGALLYLLHRKLDGRLVSREWLLFVLKLVAAAAIMWATTWFLGGRLSKMGISAIPSLIGLGLVAATVYMVVSHLLGMAEPRLLFSIVPWRRLHIRSGGATP